MNLLSDDEIEQHFENASESVPGRELRRRIGRAIEADVLSKFQSALSARKPLTGEQRAEVFRAAESRMVHAINLSWRNAVVDEVERAHGIGLEVKP